jgi:hypothetical protein
MEVIQRTSSLSDGLIRHKVYLYQNPPTHTDFIAAAEAQSVFLVGIPAKSVVVGVMVVLKTQFAAFGMSLCTVTVGTTSQSNNAIYSDNFYMPAFSCTQAVSPTSFMYWSPYAMYTTDAQDLRAVFVSTGAQLRTITAGAIEFTIMYRQL